MKRYLAAIDLFCGCGGMTLGLRRAGFRVLGGIDNDPLSVLTYKANHPDVHVWEEDIRNVKTRAVLRKLGLRKGGLDLLASCPPCQGFSSMTTRNGHRRVRDNRNELIFEFLRFVEDLTPRALMMENVPGVAKDRRFARLWRQLEELGYHLAFDIRNAANYGVPQRRRRLILVGSLYGKVDLPRAINKRVTVREAIGGLPKAGRSGDIMHDLPECRSKHVRDLIARIPKDGGSRTDLPKSQQLQCHLHCDGFKDVYGRMAWDEVAPTITSGCFNPSKGRFLHPSENRTITMREAALLQSFPKRYKFLTGRGKSGIAELIGNALPPEFVRRHARAVRQHLREHSLKG